MLSRIILTVFLLILLPALCTAQTLLSGSSSWPVASGSDSDIPKGTYLLRDEDTVSFKEVWGFVNQWSVSSTWNKDMPVTDVCLFAGDFNCYGEIVDMPKRSRIPDAGNARVHAVYICDGTSLSHLVLNSEFGYRDRLIDEMVTSVVDFDGLMLDFESIPTKDGDLFMDFVRILSNKLKGKKLFSICVPARTGAVKNDIFPYTELASLADRIFIMAYDQHWSGSASGPIAGLDWSIRIANYAKKTIPHEKIIMGMPFYGRTWATDSGAGAWTYPGINRILQDEEIPEVTYDKGSPTFSYTTEVSVTGYYNDAWSVFMLSKQYEQAGISSVGFWRIGQEDPSFWEHLNITPEGN